MRLGTIGWIVAVAVVLFFFAAPLYWMVTMAFKPEVYWAFSPPPMFPPQTTSLNFYRGLFVMGGVKGILDSLFIATTNSLISLFFGTLAGYGLSRYLPRSKNLSFFILSQRMLPAVAFAVPFYLLYRSIHLYDSYLGIILVDLTFNLPLAVWMMKNFLDEIPRELDESAQVDGASIFRTLRSVVVPTALPGIVGTGLLLFMFSWNEFVLNLFLTIVNVTPLPTLIPKFTGSHNILYGDVSAVALVASIPIIIVVIVLQKQLVRALTFGGVK
jgi:ABC-type glycerol-3-phosphate transport system permease component